MRVYVVPHNKLAEAEDAYHAFLQHIPVWLLDQPLTDDAEDVCQEVFIKLLKEKGVVDKRIEEITPFLKKLVDNEFIDAVEEVYDFCNAGLVFKKSNTAFSISGSIPI